MRRSWVYSFRRTEYLMDEQDKPKAFRTLRGFLAGHEPDEEDYFCSCATLRIHGVGVPFDEISSRLGVQPTRLHRVGERKRSRSEAVYRDDAWHYRPDVPETEPLDRHVEALWRVVRPHVDYLKALKRNHMVDVFCGFRSNNDHAGVHVSHQFLEMFIALEVPFGLSIIVT